MKKKLLIVALILGLVLLLTGCACKHEWTEATCLTPKTCQKCGEIEGEALGHTWVDADCVTPKTCSVCAVTEGEALGHTWVDADCVTPKTCSVCAVTEGEALGHTWVDADCVTPKTCSVCSATEGEALGHTWVDADCVTPKTCSVCAATEGEALGHTWVDADCVTPKTCSVCAATEGEALGHAWVDATCEAPKTCSVCAITEGQALGHTWVAAKCVTPKTCFVCAATEGEALGHTGDWVIDGEKMKRTCTTCAAEETADFDPAVFAESLLRGEWGSTYLEYDGKQTFCYAEYGTPLAFFSFGENRTGSIFFNLTPPIYDEFTWKVETHETVELNDGTSSKQYLIHAEKDGELLCAFLLTPNIMDGRQLIVCPGPFGEGEYFILEKNTNMYAQENIDRVLYKQNFLGDWTSEDSAYELTITDGYTQGSLFGADFVVLTPSEAMRTDFSQIFSEETVGGGISTDYDSNGAPFSYHISSNSDGQKLLTMNEDGSMTFIDGSGTEIVFIKNPTVEE